jgi:hypothetical protein
MRHARRRGCRVVIVVIIIIIIIIDKRSVARDRGEKRNSVP